MTILESLQAYLAYKQYAERYDEHDSGDVVEGDGGCEGDFGLQETGAAAVYIPGNGSSTLPLYKADGKWSTSEDGGKVLQQASGQVMVFYDNSGTVTLIDKEAGTSYTITEGENNQVTITPDGGSGTVFTDPVGDTLVQGTITYTENDDGSLTYTDANGYDITYFTDGSEKIEKNDAANTVELYDDEGSKVSVEDDDGIEFYKDGELYYEIEKDIEGNYTYTELHQADGSVLRKNADGEVVSITLPDETTTATYNETLEVYTGQYVDSGITYTFTYDSDGIIVSQVNSVGTEIDKEIEYFKNGVRKETQYNSSTPSQIDSIKFIQIDGTTTTIDDPNDSQNRIISTVDAQQNSLDTTLSTGSTGSIVSFDIEVSATCVTTVFFADSKISTEFDNGIEKVWDTDGIQTITLTDGTEITISSSGDISASDTAGHYLSCVQEYDGRFVVYNADGTLTYLLIDGVQVQAASNGLVKKTEADGKIKFIQPDGTTTTVDTDSTYETKDPANNTLSTTRENDGTLIIDNGDDTTTTIYTNLAENVGDDTDGSYTMVTSEGIIYFYDTDTNDNRLLSIHLPEGSKIVHTYNIDGTMSITYPDGTVEDFNSNGVMTKVTYPDGGMEEYFTNGMIYKRTYPNGMLEEYDQNDDIVQITDAEGFVTTFDENMNPTRTAPNGLAKKDCSDGSVEWTLPDDTVLTVNVNSNLSVVKQGDTPTAQNIDDGRYQITYSDGTVTVLDPYNYDLSTTVPSGVIFLNKAQEGRVYALPDGTRILADTEPAPLAWDAEENSLTVVWNGNNLEVTYTDGTKRILDTTDLSLLKKDAQGNNVWKLFADDSEDQYRVDGSTLHLDASDDITSIKLVDNTSCTEQQDGTWTGTTTGGDAYTYRADGTLDQIDYANGDFKEYDTYWRLLEYDHADNSKETYTYDTTPPSYYTANYYNTSSTLYKVEEYRSDNTLETCKDINTGDSTYHIHCYAENGTTQLRIEYYDASNDLYQVVYYRSDVTVERQKDINVDDTYHIHYYDTNGTTETKIGYYEADDDLYQEVNYRSDATISSQKDRNTADGTYHIHYYDTNGTTETDREYYNSSDNLTQKLHYKADGTTIDWQKDVVTEGNATYHIHYFAADGVTETDREYYNSSDNLIQKLHYEANGTTLDWQKDVVTEGNATYHIHYFAADGVTEADREYYNSSDNLIQKLHYEADGTTLDWQLDIVTEGNSAYHIHYFAADGVTETDRVYCDVSDNPIQQFHYKADGTTVDWRADFVVEGSVAYHIHYFGADGVTEIDRKFYDSGNNLLQHIHYKSDGVTVDWRKDIVVEGSSAYHTHYFDTDGTTELRIDYYRSDDTLLKIVYANGVTSNYDTDGTTETSRTTTSGITVTFNSDDSVDIDLPNDWHSDITDIDVDNGITTVDGSQVSQTSYYDASETRVNYENMDSYTDAYLDGWTMISYFNSNGVKQEQLLSNGNKQYYHYIKFTEFQMVVVKNSSNEIIDIKIGENGPSMTEQQDDTWQGTDASDNSYIFRADGTLQQVTYYSTGIVDAYDTQDRITSSTDGSDVTTWTYEAGGTYYKTEPDGDEYHYRTDDTLEKIEYANGVTSNYNAAGTTETSRTTTSGITVTFNSDDSVDIDLPNSWHSDITDIDVDNGITTVDGSQVSQTSSYDASETQVHYEDMDSFDDVYLEDWTSLKYFEGGVNVKDLLANGNTDFNHHSYTSEGHSDIYSVVTKNSSSEVIGVRTSAGPSMTEQQDGTWQGTDASGNSFIFRADGTLQQVTYYSDSVVDAFDTQERITSSTDGSDVTTWTYEAGGTYYITKPDGDEYHHRSDDTLEKIEYANGVTSNYNAAGTTETLRTTTSGITVTFTESSGITSAHIDLPNGWKSDITNINVDNGITTVDGSQQSQTSSYDASETQVHYEDMDSFDDVYLEGWTVLDYFNGGIKVKELLANGNTDFNHHSYPSSGHSDIYSVVTKNNSSEVIGVRISAGPSMTEQQDGTWQGTDASGNSFIFRADGTLQQVTYYSDSVVDAFDTQERITSSTDGSDVTTWTYEAGGTYYETKPNGDEYHHRSDDTLEKIEFANGSTENYAANGTTKTSTTTDSGITVTFNSDGTIDVDLPNGWHSDIDVQNNITSVDDLDDSVTSTYNSTTHEIHYEEMDTYDDAYLQYWTTITYNDDFGGKENKVLLPNNITELQHHISPKDGTDIYCTISKNSSDEVVGIKLSDNTEMEEQVGGTWEGTDAGGADYVFRSDGTLQETEYSNGVVNQYDTQERQTSKYVSGVGTTTWTYNINGTWEHEFPSGRVDTYDSQNRISTIYEPGTGTTTFSYNIDGTYTKTEPDNTVSHYRADNTLSQIDRTNGDVEYYSEDGTYMNKKEFDSDGHTEEYDSQGRITKYINSDDTYDTRAYDQDGTYAISYFDANEDCYLVKDFRSDDTLISQKDIAVDNTYHIHYYDTDGTTETQRKYYEADNDCYQVLTYRADTTLISQKDIDTSDSTYHIHFYDTDGTTELRTEEYRADDTLSEITYANGDIETYNTSEQLIQKYFDSDDDRTEQYDPSHAGRLTRIDYADASYVIYTYDDEENTYSMEYTGGDNDGVVEQYDDQDRIVSRDIPDDGLYTWEYFDDYYVESDPETCWKIVYPDGKIEQHDAENQLVSVYVPGEGMSTYDYSPEGYYIITRPDGTIEELRDSDGSLQKKTFTDGTVETYDVNGLITSKDEPGVGMTTWEYFAGGGYRKELTDGTAEEYDALDLLSKSEAADNSYISYYYEEGSETYREYYRSDETLEKVTYTSGNYLDDEIINQYYDTDGTTLIQQDYSDDHIEYYDSENRIEKYVNSDGSYDERTYETDGSKEIIYYNSSEEYQKTEYYRTDGTLDKIIYANEMVEYYDNEGVNWIRKEYADGSIVVPLANGWYQQTNGNGDVETYDASNVLRQVNYANGDQVFYRANSTIEKKTYADSRARFREYYATDGTTIVKYDISTGGSVTRSVNGSDVIWTTTSEDVSSTDEGTDETWALPDNIEIVDGATLTATHNSTPFDSVTRNGDLITLVMNSYDYEIILDTVSYSVTYEADSGLKCTLRADGFATWELANSTTYSIRNFYSYYYVVDGNGNYVAASKAWGEKELTVNDSNKLINLQDDLTVITSYKSMLNEYIYADGSKKLEYFIGDLNEKFTTEISADEQTITTKDENNNSVTSSFVSGDIEVTDGNRTITIEYDNFDGSYTIEVDNSLAIACTTTTPREYELPDGTTITLSNNYYNIYGVPNNIVLYEQSWYPSGNSYLLSAKDSNQVTRPCSYSSGDGSYTVTNGDGSMTRVKTDFTLVTSVQNGMQHELYDDGSEKYTQPDGIWTTVSADGQTVHSEDVSQNSLTTTRDQDGTLHITRTDGSEVTIAADLDSIEDYDWIDFTYYRNGTKKLDLPNGTTIYLNYVENEYGITDDTVYTNSDGSVVWRYYGNKFTMDANHNIIVSAPDGRYCKWSANGDIDIVHPDGKHTYTKSDNTLETKDIDGNILTTTVDSEGKVTVENQDGSTTTIDLDGNWMINYDNGVFVRNYLEVNSNFTYPFSSKRIYLPSNLYLQIKYDGSILSGNTHSFKGETWNHVPSPVRNSDGSYSFTANGIAYHLDTDFNLKATKGTGISRLEWISNTDGSIELRDGTDYNLSMDTSETITVTDKFGNALSATHNQDGSFTTTLANGTEVTIYQNLEKKVECLSGLTILYRTNGTKQITVPDPLISGGLVIEINSSGTITSSKENGVDRSWTGQVITLGDGTSIEISGDVIKHTATDGTYTKRLAENTVESYNSSDQLTGTTYSTSLYNWNDSTVVRGTNGTVTSITEADSTTATWDSQNSKWVSELTDGSTAEYNSLGVLTSHIRDYDNDVEVKIEGDGTITYTIPDGGTDTIEIERELDDDLTATRNSQTYSETPSILDDGGIRIENNDGLISTLETDKDLKITDAVATIFLEVFNSNGTWELHNYDGSIVQKNAQGTITSFLTVDNANPTFDDPGYHAVLNDGSTSYYDSDGRLTYNIDTIITGYTKKITAEGALRYDLDNGSYYVEVKGGSATTDGTSATVDGSGNITVNITGGKYIINSESDITFYDDDHYHYLLTSGDEAKKIWTLFSNGTKDLFGSDGSVTHLNSSGSVTFIVTREGTNATEQQDDTWEATLFDGSTSYFDTDGIFVENFVVKAPYTYSYNAEGIKWEYDSGMIKEQLTDGTIKWTQPNGTVSTITGNSTVFYYIDPDGYNAPANSNLTLETKDSSETTLSSRFPVVYNPYSTDTANTRSGEIIINNGDYTFTYIFSTGLRVIYDGDDGVEYITEILQPDGVKSTYNGSSWTTVDKDQNSLTTTDNQDGTFTVNNPEGGSFTWKAEWVNSSGFAQEYWKLITENGLEIEHNPEKVVNHDSNYHQKWVTNFGQTCEIEANVYNITITQGYSVTLFDSLSQVLKYNITDNDIYYEVALDLSEKRYTIDGVNWTYYADGSEFITQTGVGYTKIAPDDTASSMDMAYDTASTTIDENDNVVVTGNSYDVTIAPDGARVMEFDNGLEIDENDDASGTWTLPDDTVLTVAANRASATAVASDNTSLTCYKLSDGSFKVYNLNGSQTIIMPDFKLIYVSYAGYLTTTIDQDNSKTIGTSFGYTIDINAGGTSAEVHNADGDNVSCTLNGDGTVTFELNNGVEMTVSAANTSKLERGDIVQEIFVDGSMKFTYQGNEIFLNSAGNFDVVQSRDSMNRTFLNPKVYSNGSLLMFHQDFSGLWLPSLITEGSADSYSDSARWDVVDSDTTDCITILEHADGIFTRIDQLVDRTEYAANGLRINYRAYGWKVIYLPNLDRIIFEPGKDPYAKTWDSQTLSFLNIGPDLYCIKYSNGDRTWIDSQEMKLTYDYADGSRKVLYSDGTFVVYDAEGTQVASPDAIEIENQDGTTASRSYDGTVTFTTPDSSVPTQNDDGTWSNTFNNGDQALYTSDGVLMTYTDTDGVTKIYERDGTLMFLETGSGISVQFFGEWDQPFLKPEHFSWNNYALKRVIELPSGECIDTGNENGEEIVLLTWMENVLATSNFLQNSEGDEELFIYEDTGIKRSLTADYELKYFDNDGNLEKILKPNGDIEFYHSWGDIDYVEHPDGTKDVHNPDGSVVSFNAQGAITGIVKNGTSASLVDNVWTLVETGGPTTTYYSDSQTPATYGRPNLLTETDGDVNQYHYNEQNHENGSWTRTLANTTVIEYRPDGTRISQIDPNGDVTTFSEEDRIVHIEYDAGGFDDYTYFDDKGTYLIKHSAGGEELKRQEDNSNVRVVDAEGNITIYNADGKPVGKITSDGVTFNFVHNSNGTSTATGTDGTIEEYNAQGELVSVTDPDGIILEYIDDATTETKKTFVNGLEVTVKKNDTVEYLLEDGSKAVVTLDTNGIPTGVTAEDDQQNSLDAEFDMDGKIISIELGDANSTVVRITRANVYSGEGNTVLEHTEGDVLTGVIQGVAPNESFNPASIHTGKGVLTEYVLGEGPGGKTVTYADGKKEYYNQLPVENTSEEETEPSWELYKVEDPNADNSEGEPSTTLYLYEGTTVEYDSTGAIMRILNPEGEEVTLQDDGAYVGLSSSGTKYSYRVVVEGADTVVKPFSVVYSDGRIKIYTKDSSWTVSDTRSESFATYNQKGYITSQRDGEGNFSEYADMGTLMEIVHTDGSIDCYDPESGELQFTLYSQDITAEGINQGDKDIYQADGSVLREDAQGNIISITLPDGVTTAAHQADGTYEGTDSETGCIHTYRPDGTPHDVEYPTGGDIDTVIYWRNGTVNYNYANGDVRTEQYTGTVVVVQADGTNITYNVDGSVSYEIKYDSNTHARRISQDADGMVKIYYFVVDGQSWVEKARTEDAGENEIITYIGSTGPVYRRDQYGRVFKKNTPTSNEVEITGNTTETVTDSSSNTVVEFEWNPAGGYTDGAFKVEMPSGDYYISESGGRLTEYDATAQTTTTTNINGLVKVLNSDATYNITQPDGTTIELDANDDLTVTIPDGSTITTPDGGSAAASLAQDSECEINPADQSIYLEEDSSLTIWYADGKVEIRYGYDPENHAVFESNVIYYNDGKVEENNSDGSKTEYFTDGKTISTDADSNTVTRDYDGTVEEVKDGITTTVYIDGAREKIEADGTKFRYEEDSNGRVIVTTLTDGTVVTRESDGDVVVTDEPSGGSAILDQNANNEYYATLADDVVITWRTGGDMEILQADGSTLTQALDGRVILEQTDGTIITQLLDGTLIKKTSDGVETIQTPDGNIITKDTEGKLDFVGNISIEVDPDGSVTKWESDGTVVTVDTEGNVTTWNTDGSRVTETIHGMTITYNTDESTVYSFDADSTTVTQTPRPGTSWYDQGIDLTWNVASGSQIAALTENSQVLTVTLTGLTMTFRQQGTFALDDPWEFVGSDKVTFAYSDGRVTEIDDLTTTIGEVRYTWSQSGDVTVTGPDFEVRWQSSNGYITYYKHDQYNPVTHFRMVVKPNGVVETASADTNHHYTFVPFTNAAADGPASVPVSNLTTSYAGPTTAGTKLELKDNTTPYYRYVDNYGHGGGVTNPEVYVLNYSLDSNFGGGWTGAGFAQKSKLNRFVIWSDKIANKPLVFANDIEFIRDTEDHLSLYVDGASFNGKVYGTKYGDIDKSSPYWAAWISALEGKDDAIQYYKVKGSDGQGGTDVVINCRPVSVLGPPTVGKRLAYEEAVIENGINIDKSKELPVSSGTSIQYIGFVADDDGYNQEYMFKVNGVYYRSELKPMEYPNFAIKAPSKKDVIPEKYPSVLSKVADVISKVANITTFNVGYGIIELYKYYENASSVLVTPEEFEDLMDKIIYGGSTKFRWNDSVEPICGKEVAIIQKLLGNVEITGEFKQATENAVEELQKSIKTIIPEFEISGVFDRETFIYYIAMNVISGQKSHSKQSLRTVYKLLEKRFRHIARFNREMDQTVEFLMRIYSDLIPSLYYAKFKARFKGTQIIANAIEVCNDPAMIELLAHYKVWYYDSTERSCDYAADHVMDDLKAEVPDELAKKYLFLRVRFSSPNVYEPDNGILVIDKERELSNLPENLKYLLQVKCNLSKDKNLTLLLENIDPQTPFLYAGSDPVKPIWHLSEFRGWSVEWFDEYTIW